MGASHEHDELDDRDRFLATLAHQIRTPLTAVVGILELLSDGAVDAIEAKELLDHAKEQAARLGSMVDRFLVAGRVTTGTLTLRTVEVDLGGLVEEVVDAVALPTHLRVDVETAGSVTGDEARLRDVIESLVENAIRFAKSAIRITFDAPRAELVVANDGDPVPMHLEARIFEFFASSGRAGLDGALGLGLAMGREVMRAMGGDLLHRRRGDETEFVMRFAHDLEPEAATAVSPPAASALGMVPIVDVTRASTAGYLLDRGPTAGDIEAFRRIVSTLPPNRLLFAPFELVEGVSAADEANPEGVVALVDHRRLAADSGFFESVRASELTIALDGLDASATPEAMAAIQPVFVVMHADAPDAGLHDELTRIGRLAAAADAFVLCLGIEAPGDLEVAQQMGVPLAGGPLVGVDRGGMWPDVSERVRRLLAAPAADSERQRRISGMFEPVSVRSVVDPSVADIEVVVDDSGRPVAMWIAGEVHPPFTAHVSEAVELVLLRAIRRPERSRHTPVIAVDAASRPVGMVTLASLVESAVAGRPPSASRPAPAPPLSSPPPFDEPGVEGSA